jgi:hypothetical protein
MLSKTVTFADFQYIIFKYFVIEIFHNILFITF